MTISSPKPMLLSVVIPAYNEAARIGPTLEATARWLEERRLPAEIIVVDDGSSDGTCDVVTWLARRHRMIKLVESSPNRGKGHAVRVGMLEATGALRLFMDADNSTPISEVESLLFAARGGADVVIASRYVAGARANVEQPWYRRAWSRLCNHVVQRGLLAGIRDTQCGFKLFTAEAAVAVFGVLVTTGWSFDLEALALARHQGYTIAEVPVTWTDDPRSRIHPLRDAVRNVTEYLRISRDFRSGAVDHRLRAAREPVESCASVRFGDAAAERATASCM